jgi:hypothetical protein
LTRDLNPVITKGAKGVIIEVWDSESFEVEFLNAEGINLGHNGEFTFTLTTKDIKECLTP